MRWESKCKRRGAKQLSEGLTSLNEQLQSTDVQSLLTMADGMTSTGSTLISETEALSEVLNTTIAGSVNSMMTNGNELMSQMDTLSKGLESYLSGDRKSTRLNSSHTLASRMPSSA